MLKRNPPARIERQVGAPSIQPGDRPPVLGNRGPAGVRVRRRGAIQRGFERRREFSGSRSIGPGKTGGRHLTAANFVQHALPRGCALAYLGSAQGIERHAGGFELLVVTAYAVL